MAVKSPPVPTTIIPTIATSRESSTQIINRTYNPTRLDRYRVSVLPTDAIPLSPVTQPISLRHPPVSDQSLLGPSLQLVVGSLLWAAALGAIAGGIIGLADVPSTALSPTPSALTPTPSVSLVIQPKTSTVHRPATSTSRPVRTQAKPAPIHKPFSLQLKPTSPTTSPSPTLRTVTPSAPSTPSTPAENTTCANGNPPPACTPSSSPDSPPVQPSASN